MSTPCTVCVPITTLFYEAMCKGLDINNTFSLSTNLWEFPMVQLHIAISIVEILVQQLCDVHFSWTMLPGSGQCVQIVSATAPPCDVSSACCYWTALEMLVHSHGEGALTASLTTNVSSPSNQPLATQLLCLLKECVLAGYFHCVEKIRMITAFIWMYEHSSISVMDDYLQELHEELKDQRVKDDILELKDILHKGLLWPIYRRDIINP